MKITTALTLIALAIGGCMTDTNTHDGNKADRSAVDRELTLEILPECEATGSQDTFVEILDARIEGSSLVADVSYFDNCSGESALGVCTTGTYNDYGNELSEINLHFTNEEPGACAGIGYLEETVSVNLISQLGPAEAVVTPKNRHQEITLRYAGATAGNYSSIGLKELLSDRIERVQNHMNMDQNIAFLDGGEYLGNRRASARQMKKILGEQIEAALESFGHGWSFDPEPGNYGLGVLEAFSPRQTKKYLESLESPELGYELNRSMVIVTGPLKDNLRHIRVFRVGPETQEIGYFSHIITGQTKDGKLIGVLVGEMNWCDSAGVCG